MKTKTQIQHRIDRLKHQAEGCRLLRQELLDEKNPKKNKDRCEALLGAWDVALHKANELEWVLKK